MKKELTFKDIGIPLIVEKQISIIPVIPNSKRPGVLKTGKWVGLVNWTEYSERLPNVEECKLWSEMESSIGICTGKVSNIIALDFDYHDEFFADIERKLGISPLKKKGEKGFTAFYKYNNEKTKKWLKGGKTVVELLSDGRQTVLPPSLHPCGIRYEWMGESSLSNCDLSLLPSLPENYSEIINSTINSNQTKSDIKIENIDENHVKEKIIIDALGHISPEDYEVWIRVGMALCSWNTKAFELWDKWSSSSVKYKPEEMLEKWNSFGKKDGYTIATLFFEAKNNGYLQTPGIFDLEDDSQNSVVCNKETIEKSSSFVMPSEVISSAPNLVGKIMNWILSTSLYPQPELALAASLSIVSVIKAGRVCTDTKLKTNNYIVGIAPAGSGKDHGITCCQEILFQSNSKILFGGKPVSDSGILSMLDKGSNKLIIWDEIGLALKNFNSKKAGSWEVSIIKLLMELFSSASRTYHGKEYSNRDGESPRKDIICPCVSIYGITAPIHFYEALTDEMIADGFLSRLIVFEISEYFPKKRKSYNYDLKVPDDILSEIDEIKKGQCDNIFQNCKVIPFENDAEMFLEELDEEFHSKKQGAHKLKEGLQSFYSRALEHVRKIALTVQTGETITLNDVIWASKLVKHNLRGFIKKAENGFQQGDFFKKVEKAEGIIKAAGPDGISRSEFSRKVQRSIGNKNEYEGILKFAINEKQSVKVIRRNNTDIFIYIDNS